MRATVVKEDKTVFNRFMEKHRKGHVLQTSQWGDIKSKTNWEPLCFLILEKEEPKAGALILKRSLPLLGKTLFYLPRGPVLDPEDNKTTEFFVTELKKLMREHGAIMSKVDPDVSVEDQNWQDFLRKYDFVSAESKSGFDGIQPKFVFRLDIKDDEEILLKNFHQKTRYNIRLAKKKGVEIKIGKREDIPVFYDILKETTERDNFLVRSQAYFFDLYDYLVPAGYGELFLAYYEGRPIAGTFLLTIGTKAWYLYGASSNKYRNVMPNYLIQWEMIRWSKARGCDLYDFRGVPGKFTPDNPLYGLYRFKKGFNGDYVEFIGEYDLIGSLFYYRAYNFLEPLYYKWVRKLIAFKKKIFAQ